MESLGCLLAFCLAAGCETPEGRSRGLAQVDASALPGEDIVQLRQATLPSVLGAVAVHYWFAVFSVADGKWSRWEVWQQRKAGPVHWGHVHKDLMHPDSGVGGGAAEISHEWRGEAARRIITVLANSANYPYRDTYRAWPGPNSNTYAAWVLRKARVPVDLHPKAIGKDYFGLAGGGVSSTRTGIQGDTLIAGLKLGLQDGAEAHVLGLTFGVDLHPPAIKTPLGRLGKGEDLD